MDMALGFGPKTLLDQQSRTLYYGNARNRASWKPNHSEPLLARGGLAAKHHGRLDQKGHRISITTP
jgi:hypothetical protein